MRYRQMSDDPDGRNVDPAALDIPLTPTIGGAVVQPVFHKRKEGLLGKSLLIGLPVANGKAVVPSTIQADQFQVLANCLPLERPAVPQVSSAGTSRKRPRGSRGNGVKRQLKQAARDAEYHHLNNKKLKMVRSAIYNSSANQDNVSPSTAQDLDITVTNKSSSGWQGGGPGFAARLSDIRHLAKLGKLAQALKSFSLIAAEDTSRATFIRDSMGRLIFWRSAKAQFYEHIKSGLLSDIQIYLKTAYASPSERLANPRGDHHALITGYHRAYVSKPILTGHHTNHMDEVLWLHREGGFLDRLTQWVNICLIETYPAIAKRYQHSVNFYSKAYGIKAHHGLFWNFCLNAPVFESNQTRVHTVPHIDKKNLAGGVCGVFIYCFNQSKWLAYPRLGTYSDSSKWASIANRGVGWLFGKLNS